VTTQVAAALDLLAGLVLEDGRRWGEAAADFRPPPDAVRGGSKTADLGGDDDRGDARPARPARCCTRSPPTATRPACSLTRSRDTPCARPKLRGLLDVQAYRVAAVRNGSLVYAADAPPPGACGPTRSSTSWRRSVGGVQAGVVVSRF
jgi:hypothetical protein